MDNCSTYAVDVGGAPKGPTYTLDIFSDSSCVRRTGRQHDWRSYVDDKGCFDVLDKPTGNLTTMNFKLMCGSSGTGVVVQQFSGTACTGSMTEKQGFESKFYLVNWAEFDAYLFMGKCQDLRDGTYGKFRTAVNTQGYQWPDCSKFAKNGFLSAASNQSFQYRIYPGNITTVRNAHAWRIQVHWSARMLIIASFLCANIQV